jgi:hypothetical protein
MDDVSPTYRRLEDELSALVDRLRSGGTQQQCNELRERIASVREAIQHRERNIAFVRDEFVDDDLSRPPESFVLLPDDSFTDD